MNFIEIGQILTQISNTSGTNEKINILKTYNDPDFKKILQLAYDPYIKFYVNKIPIEFISHWVQVYAGEELPSLTVQELEEYLTHLSKRYITGDAAISLAAEIYFLLPLIFQPFLLGILSKDLGIGIGEALINKAFKDLIPEYKVPLCARFNQIKIQNLEYPLYCEPKKDGIRCIAQALYANNTDEYDVKLFARSGLQLKGFDLIEYDIKALLKHAELKEDIIFDGEIKDEAFQQTMQNARRIHNQDTSNATYTIWDTLPLKYFEQTESGNQSLELRKELLRMYFCGFNSKSIKPIEYSIVNSYPEILDLFSLYFTEKGEEGIIVKDPKSLYFYGRKKPWFKLKIQDFDPRKAEYSVVLTGMQLGDLGKKYQNTLGRFCYEGIAMFNGEKVQIEGEVGSGFSDLQRNEFFNNGSLIGQVFDVTAQEVTKNKSGKYSLRFPIFKCFRPDLSSTQILGEI